MLASPEFIILVEKLGRRDLFRSFKTGAHLIRGYADLGHEEFVLVGAGKLISLYTGTPSNLPEGHEHFFSRVPTIDEMTNLISRGQYDIKVVQFKEQRNWTLTAEHIESKKLLSSEHREFECALAILLLEIYS